MRNSPKSLVALGALVALNLLALTAPAQAQMATGSYTGDGTDNRAITGLGFQPDIVIIKVDHCDPNVNPSCPVADATSAVIRTSTMPGDSAKPMVGTQTVLADLIQSLDADGFTVGTDLRVNASNSCGADNLSPCTYYWTAWKSDGDVKVGTYTGNGSTQSITGVGFSPNYVLTMCECNKRTMHRTSTQSFGPTLTQRFTPGAGDIADAITSLDADGFTVNDSGSSGDSPNANAQAYHYVAWNAVAGKMMVGEYTGNAVDNRPITGLSFQPEYVVVNNYNSSADAVLRSDQMAGDASMNHRRALRANLIQALLADGFQIGNHTNVNDAAGDCSGKDCQYFYAAFNAGAGGGAALTLADHVLGQVGDKFTTTSPVTDVLFRFELSRSGTVTIDNVRVNFTTGGGVANGDVTNGELWQDVNNDGVVDVGDTLIQGGITPVGGVLTFTTNFSPSTAGTNYLVRATVANLVLGDTTTFSLGTADIDELEVVTEAAIVNTATHTQDGTLTLADHDLGQANDAFTSTTPVTDVLFRFHLTRTGTVTIDNLRVNFTTAGGVLNGDVSSGELYEDVDNNGAFDSGTDILIQGGRSPSGGVLTFTNNFTPSTAGTNYLVRATVANLLAGDTTTFSVGTADIDQIEGTTEAGSTTNAVHTQDAAAASLTLANHGSGQVGDKFTTTTPVTDVLFRFHLTRSGTVTIDNLRVNFTTAGGVANGDVSSGELYEDVNDNGAFDSGTDTLIQGSVTPVGGVLTFTTDFTPGTSGTNYLLRATVANLVDGDTTTFSVGTADIDELEAVAESGSISNATHTQGVACSPTINYRSLGTNTGVLASTGTASVPNGSTVVTFSADLPVNVGRGDALTLDPSPGVNETVHILSRDSDTQVTLQSAVTNDHSGGVNYEIRRAFPGTSAIQDWETARQGDLVTNNRREVGIAYNDGAFTPAAITTIAGSTTDACHFLWLTVAEGHRHNGTAGTGVVLDGQDADRGIRVEDDYTIIDGFELTRNRGGVSAAAVVVQQASNVLLENLLIHDFVDGTQTVYGVRAQSNAGYTVRNSIIYDGDSNGIRNNDSTAAGTVQNCTVYGMVNAGILNSAGTLTVSNTISMNNGTFDFNGTITHSYNISEDGSASCGTCLPNRDFTDNSSPGAPPQSNGWVIFNDVDIASGTEDFHLQDNATNDAIDAGDDLSSSFWADIDGESRLGVSWDIGADEAGEEIAIVTGTYTGTGTAGLQITGLGFKPDVVLIKGDLATTAGAMRTSTMSSTKPIWGTDTVAGNLITSLDVDGFTVGSDTRVNALNICGAGTDPCQYYWTAFKAGSNLKLGTYTGDGTAAQNITGLGFSPEYVIILSEQNEYAYHRMSTGGSRRIRNGSPADTIAALGADGFTVAATGTAGDDMNEAGQSYHYVAFNEVAGQIKVGSYPGNSADDHDITGVGFQPEYVLLQNGSDDATYQRSDKMAGDASSDFNSELLGNRIQALLADGFQVGSYNPVNESLKTYAYVAFNAEPFTTAVTLTSFTARGFDGEVLAEWETASELENLGFHLYRATAAEGPYEKLTVHLIPGLGSSPSGAKYRFRDLGVDNGTTYFYRLEDVETSGRTELHGPVSATPQAGAAPDAPTEAPSGGASLVTVGNPGGNLFRVLDWSEQGATIELLTEGFYAEPLDDGSVRLEIPDFEPFSDGDSPSLPITRPWIDARAGVGVELLSVEESSIERFSSLRPSGPETVELITTPQGVLRPARVIRSRSSSSAQTGLFPAQAARILTTGFQGELKKVQLEMAPLRWDDNLAELRVVRRMLVRLAFTGRATDETSRGRLYRARKSHRDRQILARFAVSREGLQVVAYEQLFGTGSSAGLAADRLRLGRLGDTVPFFLQPNPTRFVPGSRLYFFSRGPRLNPYGNEAVYELELRSPSGDISTMEAVSTEPTGETLSYAWKPSRNELDRFYQAGLLDAPDLWLWDVLVSPVTKAYAFELHRLASTTEPGRLSLWLQGASDFEADPDHHLRVFLNRQLVAETSWNGKKPQRLDVELPPGILTEGANTLELENVGDTAAAYSMVFLDKFTVDFPHTLSTDDGAQLEAHFARSGLVRLDAAGSSAYVVDITDQSGPRWLSRVLTTPHNVQFRAEAGRRYAFATASTLFNPELRRPAPPRLKTSHHGADYLVIAPQAFLDELYPLVSLRRSQGLTTEIVPIEQVYEEFGFGEARPEAVRDFLAYAYHHWGALSPPSVDSATAGEQLGVGSPAAPKNAGLRYVLLVGDATYDFKDFLGTGVGNQIAPLIVPTSYLWTASDPLLAAVNGDDLLPDVAIGRLPAANSTEARTLVDKILAYENGPWRIASPDTDQEPPAPLILIADDPDDAGDFVANAEELATGVLAGKNVRKLYLSQLGAHATRDRILQAFDDGASLVSYMGHGGIPLWANENIFNRDDVALLSPQSHQPLLVTMNCLNGYFHFPYFNSLAEELLKAEDKGIVAAFSPTGLSLNEPAHRFHQALLHALLHQGHTRLGDAVLSAQEAYAQTGAFPELLTIYHLLGDPALSLR